LAQGWSLSEAVLTAGQATADNLPHSIAQVQFLWRTPTVEMAEAVLRVLDSNAEAAARMAHCSWRGDWVSKSRPGLPNHALAEACFENLRVAGPPRYGPEAVRLAREVQAACGVEPDLVVACVGGGSNSIGIFHPFRDTGAELVGIEAGGRGGAPGDHGARITYGTPGILHGSMSRMMSTAAGQVQPAHSISAGLDYPGVGPELAHLHETGRARFESISDEEALAGLRRLSELEGIIPALESSHAIAWLLRRPWPADTEPTILLNLSGRGDKDVEQVADVLGAAS
jgi:hypothetical protein